MWPFVSRKKYMLLMEELEYLRSKEEHYWRQAALNIAAQNRIAALESKKC